MATGAARAVSLTAAARNGRDGYDAAVAPDGGRILVWNRSRNSCLSLEPERSEPVGYRCWLFDTATGECVGEPFASSAQPEIVWSADGRWFIERQSAVSGRAVRVRTAPGGEVVAEIPARPDETLDAFQAGPGGATLLWRAGSAYAVEAVDLPAGRVVRRCDLPTDGGWWLTGEAGRVVVQKTMQLPTGATTEAGRYAVDFAADPPRLALVPPPWRYDADGTSVTTTLGPTWTATTVCPAAGASVVDRLHELAVRYGWLACDRPVRRGRLTVAANGERPVALPGRVPADHVMSADGQWLAGIDERGRVEVWNADPPSPWSAAVAAGLLTTAAWAAVERRRARRATR